MSIQSTQLQLNAKCVIQYFKLEVWVKLLLLDYQVGLSVVRHVRQRFPYLTE